MLLLVEMCVSALGALLGVCVWYWATEPVEVCQSGGGPPSAIHARRRGVFFSSSKEDLSLQKTIYIRCAGGRGNPGTRTLQCAIDVGPFF